jgi:hypothetical protein
MSRQVIFSRARVVPAAAKISAAAIFSAALLFAAATPAQQPAAANSVATSRVAANKAALKKFVDASSKISPEVSKHLSRGLQNYLRYANAALNGTAGKFAAPNSAASKQKKIGWNPWNLIPVSDPALDPAAQGYTQNTTSSAWCGNTIVVGYEDSGAFFRTDPNGAFGVPLSFNGVSYSENAGKSFTDAGFLPPGTFSANAKENRGAHPCKWFRSTVIHNLRTTRGSRWIPLIRSNCT